MRRKVLSAAVWSGIEQIAANGLSTIFMIVFARVLTPSDFGSFASASLMTGFGGVIAMMGMRALIVQRNSIDEAFLSTAFWLCMLVATAINTALLMARHQIAELFGDPRVAELMPYLCAAMLASVVTGLHTSRLRRDLDMRRLARRTLAANALAGLVAVAFALLGYGPMALVVQSVGGAFLTMLFMIALLGWPFRLSLDWAIAREAVAFGAKITAADLLIYCDRESPKLVIGLTMGTEQLGIFSMALRVVNLLVNTIGLPLAALAVPVLSEVRRTRGEIGGAYLEMLRAASSLVLPLFVVAAVLSTQIIAVLLGDDWLAAAPLLSILCAMGVLVTLTFLNGSTLVAAGDPNGRLGFAGLSAAIGTVIVLAASPLGLIGVSLALVGRSLLIEPLQLGHVMRRATISLAQLLRALRAPFLASVAVLLLGELLVKAAPAWTNGVLILVLAPSLLLVHGLMLVMIDPDVKRAVLRLPRIRRKLGAQKE